MSRGSYRVSWWSWLPALLLLPAGGCAGCRSHLEQALRDDHNPAAHAPQAALGYQIHCPDLVEVNVAGHPELCGSFPVGPDGRIALSSRERVVIDTMTPTQAAQTIAEEVSLPADRVQVKVTGYNSQVLYLFGEVNGLQRAIPYQGPETLVDLLQRVGGFAPGAALGNIQVVRAHIADGKSPEVFQVDLNGILVERDQQSNLRLQPSDQVYVGQTSRSRLSCCFPPWLRPLYNCLCGIRHAPAPAPPAPPPPGPPLTLPPAEGSQDGPGVLTLPPPTPVAPG
jgi:protein involved in polysaccharide export with SLBB domain